MSDIDLKEVNEFQVMCSKASAMSCTICTKGGNVADFLNFNGTVTRTSRSDCLGR